MWMWLSAWRMPIHRAADRSSCRAMPVAAVISVAMCFHWWSDRIESSGWLWIEQCQTGRAGGFQPMATGWARSSVSRRGERRPFEFAGGCRSERSPQVA